MNISEGTLGWWSYHSGIVWYLWLASSRSDRLNCLEITVSFYSSVQNAIILYHILHARLISAHQITVSTGIFWTFFHKTYLQNFSNVTLVYSSSVSEIKSFFTLSMQSLDNHRRCLRNSMGHPVSNTNYG